MLDGPVNGESFAAYVEQILVPTLQEGDIVIMDNLGSHKGNKIHRAIRTAGAKITHSGLGSSRSNNSGPTHYGGSITAFKDDDKVEVEISELNWMFGGFGAKTPDEKTGIGIRYMVPKR